MVEDANSKKYVTLEGEGVREGITVGDRGRGIPRACDVTRLNFFHTYKT